MESKYQWKINSLGRNVDPDEALNEIQKAETIFGKITPENVLKIAYSEDSALHTLFEWDDEKAAQNYRIQQARNIINNIEIKVVSDDGPISIPVFEVVSTKTGNQYKHIEDLDFDERKYIRENTIRSINALKTKLKIYNDFNRVINHLDSAIKELETA